MMNSQDLLAQYGPRESMEYDVAIVGGGPGGLSTAIRIKQLLDAGESLFVYGRWQGGFVALLDVLRLCRLKQELQHVA